jgi:hypothetical protein
LQSETADIDTGHRKQMSSVKARLTEYHFLTEVNGIFAVEEKREPDYRYWHAPDHFQNEE